jgi:tetratricopeptide (TPR) repeat protein
VNLDLAHGVREPQLEKFLEGLPETARSAVLTERLARLYDALGKPSSAISAWQTALTLNPSPEQRIRIRLILGEKLLAQDRGTDAAENWRQLLAEAPDYPGKAQIEEKLNMLAGKNSGTNAPASPQ